jgi:ATP-dependent RNA helicase SUPV3L1/SUV3
VTVEDEPIGHLEAFRFVVDPLANHSDRRMLLAAAEKALPGLLGQRARALAGDPAALELVDGEVRWQGKPLAHLESGPSTTRPRVIPARELVAVPEADRQAMLGAVETWLAAQLAPLAPLAALEAATRDPAAGSEARALLLNLIAGHGAIPRGQAGIEHLPRELRPFLRRLGVAFGALDVFAPALLKPAARRALHAAGIDRRPLAAGMPPVLTPQRTLPGGYRPAGTQAVRVDIAEKLLRAAHDARVKAGRARHFVLDPALAVSTGLAPDNWMRLLGAAGFKAQRARALPMGALGPPAPDRWTWRPAPRETASPARQQAVEGGVFSALAALVR